MDDFSTLKGRVAHLIDTIGINRVMDELDISQSQVYRYKSDPNGVAFTRIATLCRMAGFSMSWIETGKGVKKGAHTLLGQETITIPFFDGSGSSPFHMDKEFFDIDFNLPPDAAVAIKTPDEAMSPTFQIARVCILNQTQLTGNGTFAMRIGGNLTIRVMQRQLDGSLKLSAENPMYGEIIVPKDDEGLVEILGRVVWHETRIRG